MLLEDEEAKELEGNDPKQVEFEEQEVRERDIAVSLHAMKGHAHCKTLKMLGKVGDKEILILIDSGSTHCFLDEKVARTLNCKIESTTPMMIRVADGSKLASKLECDQFTWEMQGEKFTHPVRLLKLGGYDLVLGCDWLSGYDPVEIDFSQSKITLNQAGNKLILYALLNGTKDTSEPRSLPLERSIEHCIELLPNAIPKKQHPYRYAYGQKTEIEKLVKEMLENGIIRPSQSSFASPILLVKKKDDELLDELYGAKFFSKIDLRSGYFQIRMRKEDVPKTSFITHNGHYEFLVMPFGLCNAPSTFQALMNTVFEPYLRKFVLVFFDDILVYSKDWGMHLVHLRKVMDLMGKHQLYAKQSKCDFSQKKVEYLGHVISWEGVATDPGKIESMVNWPVPSNVKALRGFLGLTGYYKRFIKDYGSISTPLTALLKKNAFGLNQEADDAFKQLKRVMTTAPVLSMPDFSKPFIVETDASGKGIGAVLMQEGKPIAYLSKALAARNLGLSTYENEFLALLLAVTKWKHYLLGNHSIIKTDQRSLKHILDQRVDSMLQQKWVTKLLGLSYEV
ncbi:UNVERIFIED_CONTAM: Retrovirus-related Pol polyprotein from transposon 17.6 [Sesamum indicum]